MTIGKYLLLGLTVLCLTACKTDLYTQLEEGEATEMMALLLKYDIGAQKRPGKEGAWILSVPEGDVTAAVERLKAEGFPRQQYQSIGDIFQKDGLVSSPLTERVRFIHALSQELGDTISRIDGVLDARVHVVLPDNDPLAAQVLPSSASIFVRYQAKSPIKDSIPQIKQLVVNGIEGLTYDKVSVAIFPSDIVPTPATPATAQAGMDRVIIAGGLLIALFFAVIYLRGRSKAQKLPEVSHA